ncbi:hypothetical protein C8R47DRAFT_1154865 [Mycena vitilis]|nr:hypothetical protein C8R47DRAFT_1154865 [Mycena vitilis]
MHGYGWMYGGKSGSGKLAIVTHHSAEALQLSFPCKDERTPPLEPPLSTSAAHDICHMLNLPRSRYTARCGCGGSDTRGTRYYHQPLCLAGGARRAESAAGTRNHAPSSRCMETGLHCELGRASSIGPARAALALRDTDAGVSIPMGVLRSSPPVNSAPHVLRSGQPTPRAGACVRCRRRFRQTSAVRRRLRVRAIVRGAYAGSSAA